jgi:outer membrane protein assembly factor BamE (lipoprotein component of BamABCDE complex)
MFLAKWQDVQMRKILAVITPLVLVVSLASCSNNDADEGSNLSADTTEMPADSTAKVAGPIEISVTVGTDSAVDRVEEVALGSQVNITLTNPNAADEFHLHEYDLTSGETPKGEAAVISFTADKAGDFDLESHVTDEVLVVISVK